MTTITGQLLDLAASPYWPYPGVATVHALVSALGLDGQPVPQQAQAVRQFTETQAWAFAPPVLQRDVRRWLGLVYESSVQFAVDADADDEDADGAPAADDTDDGPAAPVPDDKTAVALYTAHKAGDILHHLSHAADRMKAARAASGDVRAHHATALAGHLGDALDTAHGLTAHIRAHYPDEAAELEQVKQHVGLAGTITGQLLDFVGPKGYVHGWIYEGGPGLPSVASHNAKLRAKGITPPTKAHPALTRKPPAAQKAAHAAPAKANAPAPAPKSEPEALRGDAAYSHVAEPSGAKERDAADYYSVASGRINPALRNGTGLSDKTDKAQLRSLESAFDKAPPTTKHIVAYRGTTGALFGKGNATGTQFTDKGFTSVSTDRRQAGMFGSEADPAIMEIHVPAGSKVVKPGGAGHYSAGDEAEKELVLNHGGKYEITGDEMVDDPELGKIRKLTATYKGAA